jgi:hypothetical protein
MQPTHPRSALIHLIRRFRCTAWNVLPTSARPAANAYAYQDSGELGATKARSPHPRNGALGAGREDPETFPANR